MDAEIKTASTPFFRANGATNSTTAGTAPANPSPTVTKPSGAGVIDMGMSGNIDGAISSNGLIILPYGVGADDNTFVMTAFAWDILKAVGSGNRDIWVAWPLAAFTCTMGALAGVANTDLPANSLMVDTITLTANFGNANVSNEIISPAGDFQASIVLDTKGAKLVQLIFGMNSSATSANALVRRI